MLFESSPLTTDDGVVLRQSSLEIGVIHLILACLSALSHHLPRKTPASGSDHEELSQAAMQVMMAHSRNITPS